VRQIIVLDDIVAVVGDHTWAAKQGLDALDVTWNEGPNATVTSVEVWQRLRAASDKDGAVANSRGDVTKGLGEGDPLEASYELPFLAHAPMEPMNCTAHVTADACEVWLGSQVLARAQAAAAKITGLPLDKVTVHNHLLGGGFGRRLEIDSVESAVRIAQHVDGPVKVVRSREEDIQHGLSAGLSRPPLGEPVEWQDRRLEASYHGLFGDGALAAARVPERDRYRRRR